MGKHITSERLDSSPGNRALDQLYYTDAEIYQREIEDIFLRSWIYAGHVSEIPQTGDWFVFELADESVIITRGKENELNALVNVCRHRGSRICLQSRGCSKRLVCRYHGWSYELDGRLSHAAYMGDGFDKSEISLKRLHVEVLEGMIYINFSDHPAPFDLLRNAMTECLLPYRLDNARVAHRQSYPIKANWKLSLENYSECYHCAPSHPEYSKGHSLARPWEHRLDLQEEVLSRAGACGLSDQEFCQINLQAEGFGADYAYERHAMWQGHVTGSEDGQPVAPLMGTISAYDGGATDFQIGPVTFALAYCDHVVIYRFTPVSLDRSECDISWLVNGDAEEGKDYDVEKLTWLWDVTTAADKRIIENNAAGVKSRFYRPGPLSIMETRTGMFIDWYLDTIGRE